VARYILVEVDDNETAGDFVAVVQREGNVFYYTPANGQGESQIKTFTAKVVGLFAKPIKFCECPKPGDRQVRGAKFGWWVHAECGKPMKGHCQHPRNLLEPDDFKPKPDERWGYLGIWERGT